MRESMKNFYFQAEKVTSWNIRSFLKYKKSFLWRFCFLKCEKFSQGGSFFFFLTWAEKWGVHSWKYKKSFLLRKYNKTFPGRVFLGNNIRNFFRENFWVLGPKVQVFIFKNIRKVFYWENIGKAFSWEI